MTTSMQDNPRKLSKKEFNQIYWRSFTLLGSFNYERMEGLGFLYAMMPSLKRIWKDDPEGYKANAALQKRLRGELDKISHRVYDTGFYFGQPKVCGEAVGVTQEAEYMGYVLDASGGEALVEMKNRFFVGDELETVTPKGSEKLVIEDIVIERTGEHVGVVNVPMERVRIPCGGKLQAGDMLRGPVRNRA